MLCVQSNLLGAVDTVAGIAQTGNDVAVLVQVVVLCTEVDVHIGVCLVQGLDAFRSSDQTDELDALCTVLLDLGDGCLLYTSPSPRDYAASRMPASA